MGLSVVFHVFYLIMMPFSMPGKWQKWIVLFSCFTQFWACNEADEPHFSALYTPKLHLCTLVLMPGTPFPHTPKTHLGCPISPFGMSHFTFWDVPFRHLGYPISPFGVYFRHICAQCTAPIFGLSSSFSLQKFVCFFPFGSSCFS